MLVDDLAPTTSNVRAHTTAVAGSAASSSPIGKASGRDALPHAAASVLIVEVTHGRDTFRVVYVAGSQMTTGICRSVHAWYLSKSAYMATSRGHSTARSAGSAVRASMRRTLLRIWTVICGSA